MFTKKQKQEMKECQDIINKECKDCMKSFEEKNLVPSCRYGSKCFNPIVNSTLKRLDEIQTH